MNAVATLVALALAVATAHGDEVWIATAPDAAAPGLVCRVTSTAVVSQSVRVEAFAADGAPVFDSGRFALAPEAVFQSGVGAAGRVCRFELEDGRTLRAEALVFEPALQRFTPVTARRAR